MMRDDQRSQKDFSLRREWIPEVGASPGGFPWIIFQPKDVCPGIGLACDCSVVEVIASSCGSGINVGDEIEVWDFNRNAFNMPEDLLFNSYGLAHKFKNGGLMLGNPGGGSGSGSGDETPSCIWVVTQMFCVNEDTGSGSQ